MCADYLQGGGGSPEGDPEDGARARLPLSKNSTRDPPWLTKSNLAGIPESHCTRGCFSQPPVSVSSMDPIEVCDE